MFVFPRMSLVLALLPPAAPNYLFGAVLGIIDEANDHLPDPPVTLIFSPFFAMFCHTTRTW